MISSASEKCAHNALPCCRTRSPDLCVVAAVLEMDDNIEDNLIEYKSRSQFSTLWDSSSLTAEIPLKRSLQRVMLVCCEERLKTVIVEYIETLHKNPVVVETLEACVQVCCDFL